MFKRLTLIGVLVISVAMLGTEANAQIGGWAWFGFSSVHGEVLTFHTPNPNSKPSQIVVAATATVQTACFNPANNGVFNGKAFKGTVVGSGLASNGGFVQTTQGNAGKTLVELDLSTFEEPQNAHCPNPGWTVVQDSAMALDFTATVTWCLIDTTTNTLDCSSKKGLLDQESVACVLDMTNPKNQRNSDGTAPHTAVFTCPQPPQ
jgi:hypothetical protein